MRLSESDSHADYEQAPAPKVRLGTGALLFRCPEEDYARDRCAT